MIADHNGPHLSEAAARIEAQPFFTSFEHAANAAHHIAMNSGYFLSHVRPRARAGDPKELVRMVEHMRRAGFAPIDDVGKALLAYVDGLRAELGV